MTMLKLTVVLVTSLAFITEGCEKPKASISPIEAADNPEKFKGQQISWQGVTEDEIRPGDTKLRIKVGGGYIVEARTNSPAASGIGSGVELLVEGVYEGPGGTILTIRDGEVVGGGKTLVVDKATAVPAKKGEE